MVNDINGARKYIREILRESYNLIEGEMRIQKRLSGDPNGYALKDTFEIHDDKGMLMRGTQEEMTYAWGINTLPEQRIKEIYGDYINPNWVIQNIYGRLKLIQIIAEQSPPPGRTRGK